jgi:hypothetical protein
VVQSHPAQICNTLSQKTKTYQQQQQQASKKGWWSGLECRSSLSHITAKNKNKKKRPLERSFLLGLILQHQDVALESVLQLAY